MTWFVDKYLPRHKISVHVDHKGLLREGVFGWQWSTDSDSRPREFEIEIHNRLDPQQYTEALLHELWHLYQHVMGNLKDKRMYPRGRKDPTRRIDLAKVFVSA